MRPGRTVLLAALLAACGGGARPPAPTGRATARLTLVPVEARCLVIAAVGPGGPTTRQLDVAPETSPVFTLTGLPLGATRFTAEAFRVPCALIGDADPAWDSLTVEALVAATVPVAVTLALRPTTGQDTVTLVFPSPSGAGPGVALTPFGVGCVVITMDGVDGAIDVSPETSAVFSFEAWPGLHAFSARAFPVACAALAAEVPSFRSGEVSATVTAGAMAQVVLEMSATAAGRASVLLVFPTDVGPGRTTYFTVPTLGAQPEYITSDSDFIWFGEERGGYIGRVTPAGVITEFPVGRKIRGVAADGQGGVWFTQDVQDRLGFLAAGGDVTTWSVETEGGSNPSDLVFGPDGNLWWGEVVGNTFHRSVIGGDIASFPQFPQAESDPRSLTAGPDGAVWLTEAHAHQIGRISPSGHLDEYPTPTELSGPWGIAVGSDGNLWFTEEFGNAIGRIEPEGGRITEFPLPHADSRPRGIALGIDDNIWFVEEARIGRITPDGDIAEFTITGGTSPLDMTSGPDGNLWFTEYDGNRIGRVTTGVQLQVADWVHCVVISVTAAGAPLTTAFDVTPGEKASFALGGLPLQRITLSAEAYFSDCAGRTVGDLGWTSQAVTAVISATPAAPVRLEMWSTD